MSRARRLLIPCQGTYQRDVDLHYSRGAPCLSSSGSGNIGTKVNITTGGSVTFTLHATVSSFLPEGTLLSNTAFYSLPTGLVDFNMNNNSATDQDTVGAGRT